MSWWQYLMLVNIYLLLFYGFYFLLLKRETFFQLNRVYLVAAALLSFFIPLIQSEWVKNLFITQRVNYTIYTSPVMLYQFTVIPDTQVTIGQILVGMYLLGIVFLMARFAWQLVVLKKIIDQPKSSSAYSFFRMVRLGDGDAGNQVIAAHEDAHASQLHSADILLIEAVMIINWFNPVVYMYRFAIKHIHEFIADRQAIKAGTNKEAYAMLLLSQAFNTPAHQLVTPFFNHSLLKQRIIMLQKTNSRRAALVKYCLSAPLFALMLILSSATVNNSSTVRLFKTKAEQVFLIPASAAVNDIKPDDSEVTVNPPPANTIIRNVAVPAPADTGKKKGDKIFTVVEHSPEFPGGITEFFSYLGRNIRYPAKEREKGIQGRVIIGFVVEEDGALSNVHLLRGVSPGIDGEALRVLKASPNWKPGRQNGRTVRVAYSVPISFALEGDKPNKPTGVKTGGVQPRHASDVKLAAVTDIVINTDSNKKSEVFHINSNNPPPLYMLDGKEVVGINTIVPNDIESITVLKDKAATALYGDKAASGVVIITSKKNKLAPVVK